MHFLSVAICCHAPSLVKNHDLQIFVTYIYIYIPNLPAKKTNIWILISGAEVYMIIQYESVRSNKLK